MGIQILGQGNDANVKNAENLFQLLPRCLSSFCMKIHQCDTSNID